VLICETTNHRIPAHPRCLILPTTRDPVSIGDIRNKLAEQFEGLTIYNPTLDRLPDEERVNREGKGALLLFSFSGIRPREGSIAPAHPIAFPSRIERVEESEIPRAQNTIGEVGMPAPRIGEKNVLFVTNRKRTPSHNFSAEMNVGDLTWGSALVTEQSLLPDNNPVYAVVTGHTMERDSFMNNLGNASSTISSTDQVLLVIHGFNQGFEDGVELAAMVQFQCEFPGAVVAFCWPADANQRRFEDDEARYLESIEALHQVITLLRIQGKRVHILATNTGCELARLTMLRMDPGEARRSHLLFLCPDISWTDFWDELGMLLQRSVASIQYFYYPNDGALFASEWYYHTERRLGQEQSHNPSVCFSHRSHDITPGAYSDREHRPLDIKQDREFIKRLLGVF